MKRNHPASAFHRATRAESAAMGVSYSSKRYILNSTKRVTKSTPSISERAFRTKREGVTVERAIRERARGERAYASPASRVRAQRAITRNAENEIRRRVRIKNEGGRVVTEREYQAQIAWFVEQVEKKSGAHWALVGKRWHRTVTNRATQALTDDEFERAAVFYFANEKFLKPPESDFLTYVPEDVAPGLRGQVPSPGVGKRSFRRAA